MARKAISWHTMLRHAIYMYIGEMERMGPSLASILGMRPSTLDGLSNSTSNLTE
jgi:hypothetical protein